MSARLEFEIIENEGRFVFPAAAEQPYRSLLDSLVSESTTDNEFVWSLQAGVLGIFRPKTTKCSGGPAVCGLQRGITFFEIPIWALFE